MNSGDHSGRGGTVTIFRVLKWATRNNSGREVQAWIPKVGHQLDYFGSQADRSAIG